MGLDPLWQSLQPAWRTCSPSCLGTAWSGRDPAARVRLVLLQGQAGTPSRPLPASWQSFPGQLPPLYRGRQTLIWAYLLPIECFLSLFLLQPQANRWGGEKQDFQSGALLGQGTFTLGPAPSGSILLPRPSLLLRSGLAYPHICPPHLCPGPSAAIAYLRGSPPHMETLHVSPPVPKDHAKPQTPGYDIQVP